MAAYIENGLMGKMLLSPKRKLFTKEMDKLNQIISFLERRRDKTNKYLNYKTYEKWWVFHNRISKLEKKLFRMDKKLNWKYYRYWKKNNG